MYTKNIIIGAMMALCSTVIASPLTAEDFRIAKAGRNWPKIMSPNKSNGTTHGPEGTDTRPADLCKDLCGVVAQACVVAIPRDERFCYDTYVGCGERC
ncbi:hypothetical protein FE257_007001 [Aspergillus nanangensis]|uniref:Uncharacterized protein n=1 Tax=Aspergillus nanangensis TaxID=2582783 RepID=A0AAD4CNE0_ASPNN|nr:hypothetical protein FE257_007001 [Aspergillus nanangensis]